MALPTSAGAQSSWCATNPSNPWCSVTAGAQTLSEYDTLSAGTKATYALGNGPQAPVMRSGHYIMDYSDFTGTGSSTVEFTQKTEGLLSKVGRGLGKFPALKLLGTIGWGYTAFCLGYHWSDGSNALFSSICMDPKDVRYDDTGAAFPLVALTKPVYTATGVGNNFNAAGWYLQYTILSSTSYCAGFQGQVFYIAPVGSGLGQSGSDCNLRKYYGAWKALQNQTTPSTGSVVTHSSPCPTFYSGGGTSGATGCGVVYWSEADMDSNVTSTEPVPYTGTGSQAGAQNLGTVTPTGSWGSTEDAAVRGAPGTPWSSLTGAQQAAVTYIVTAAEPSYAPSSDYLAMPNCIGMTQAACTSALEAAGGTGTYTYNEATIAGADLTQDAGAVITLPHPATTEVLKTEDLEFTVNPDPLPIVILAPGANETYSSYLARLTAAGLIGTITSTELSELAEDPSRGPAAVVRTQPVAGTRVLPDTAIEVFVNPTSAPGPTPEDGGGTTTDTGDGIPPVPPPTDCSPWLDATPDLTPFNSVNAGDKFPFAIFGYMAAVFEPLTASPVTPSINWPMSLPGVGTFTFTASASGLDSYMSIWRALCAIGIWVAAVWLLAKSVLGLSFGSPGDAVEMDPF